MRFDSLRFFPPKARGRRGFDDDGFPTTAPVMSFAPSKLGQFDLGGNVSEWFEDWHSDEQRKRVLRGGSWIDNQNGILLSSFRADPQSCRGARDSAFTVGDLATGLAETIMVEASIYGPSWAQADHLARDMRMVSRPRHVDFLRKNGAQSL